LALLNRFFSLSSLYGFAPAKDSCCIEPGLALGQGVSAE